MSKAPSALILPGKKNDKDLAAENIRLAKKLLEAVKYSAHLSKLLLEACTILEKLKVEVDTSAPLAAWWEKTKRKEDRNVYTDVSHLGTTVGDGVGVSESDQVDHPESTLIQSSN